MSILLLVVCLRSTSTAGTRLCNFTRGAAVAFSVEDPGCDFFWQRMAGASLDNDEALERRDLMDCAEFRG